jgi:methionyl aminopeptidase
MNHVHTGNCCDHHEEVVTIHTPEDFIPMKKAGNLAARVLDYVAPFVKAGITTLELNDICHEYIVSNNAIPAPLNYRGFPKSICTSVNHVVCHGIPNNKKLNDGDIINIDVTVILDGWHGDTSRMFTIGKTSLQARKLIEVTFEAMHLGIEAVKAGATLGDVGHAIQQHAQKFGFSVVRDFCGHGIGKIFHTPPTVLHYGKPNTGLVLEKGMFFTIEPMINAGKYHVTVLNDGWTAVTKDRSLSAQFEHTIGVTENGAEIFTI